MKLKLDDPGHAVIQDGKPVFVHDDGKEVAIDVPAMQLRMLGCMMESSLSLTAAAHLSPLVDYGDLDSELLIDNDPFVGFTLEHDRIVLPSSPGIGVESWNS